ncbi:DUF5723 family protein [Mucilaginibacter sp. X4EP1]|uniref:DUF5723 family protein n=1 Tax=Mucilaginibacter sp. X4EP1 TaxID=2723092 RepID=UPI0021681B88|nr:DUF5723 family protein [Mucilaginibacter sp. X4EP1]MCS3815736.1 hypothetical protein [Mucilaginibacter sp. X4EP1]
MKKILLLFSFFFFTTSIFAQTLSQYNTGTLYDSFENPAQTAFILDTSKQFASNFLIPNFAGNFFLSGDAQATLKNRFFKNQYDNSALKINQGQNNLANVNADVYFLMFRWFSSFNGDVEMGISAQTKFEGHGLFTDETIAALNGTASFENSNYSNVFNSNYNYQAYNQISFSYREKVTKQFAIGFKFSALLGIEYQKLDITSSNVNYDKLNDMADVTLGGTYTTGFVPGHMVARDYLPTLRNPGASISIGTMYRTNDNFVIQANVKDLGFIHWNSQSAVYNFNNTETINGLSTPAREDSIYNAVYKIVHNNGTVGSFTTPVDGHAEVSVNKSYWLDDDNKLKYSPTLIASKELFYSGFVGGLVNPFQYGNYIATLSTSYDDLKTFSVGGQFMYKTPNFEIFIGTNDFISTGHFAYDALNKNASNISNNTAYTGLSVNFGFALKFGPVTEHPMNASTIPNGEKGFLGRVWGRLFKTDN